MKHAIRCLGAASALVLSIGVAVAQNLFAPVANVNGRVITAFERDQRVEMLKLFNTPGDLETQALNTLIDERVQLAEADRLGIIVSREEVLNGMSEFAGRANLSREEFVAQLAQAGVDVESFEDFVSAGVAWRQVVRDRFAGRVQIPDTLVDRAARQVPRAGLRVLLSEIILPANTPENRAIAVPLADELSRITTLPAFASAAREYSASRSRGRGGRLEWLPLANLPPNQRPQLQALDVGEVTAPLEIPNAIALFQLRAIEETEPEGDVTQLDFAAFYLPGGQSAGALRQAQIIESEVAQCDDLYRIANGLPELRLQRDVLPPADIPADVALELAKLDENEVSTALTRANGQTLVFLMLCNRSYADPEVEVNLQSVANQLTDRRVQGLARNYLAELRANSEIIIE